MKDSDVVLLSHFKGNDEDEVYMKSFRCTMMYISKSICEKYLLYQHGKEFEEYSIMGSFQGCIDHNSVINFDNINISELNEEDIIKMIHSIGQKYSLLFNHQNDNQLDKSHYYTYALSLCSQIEITLFNFLGYSKSMGLLRNALASSKLEDILTPACCRVLKIIFLPHGLNIRNLLWHGFLLPDDFDLRYLHLLQLLYNSLMNMKKNMKNDQKILRLEAINVDDFIIPVHCQSFEMISFLNCIDHKMLKYDLFTHISLEMVIDILRNSYLTSNQISDQGRSSVIVSAYQDLKMAYSSFYVTTHIKSVLRGRCYACSALLKILPILEHALRVLFCSVNLKDDYATEHIMAVEERYYTTLDGFGQRSKHQVMLDPILRDAEEIFNESSASGKLNRLPNHLGANAYALFVDLFMAESGPNIRAKLAHGNTLSYISEVWDSSSYSLKSSLGKQEISLTDSIIFYQNDSQVRNDTDEISNNFSSYHDLALKEHRQLCLYGDLCIRLLLWMCLKYHHSSYHGNALRETVFDHFYHCATLNEDISATNLSRPHKSMDNSCASSMISTDDEIFSVISSYRSHFHPQAILLDSFQNVLDAFMEMFLSLQSRNLSVQSHSVADNETLSESDDNLATLTCDISSLKILLESPITLLDVQETLIDNIAAHVPTTEALSSKSTPLTFQTIQKNEDEFNVTILNARLGWSQNLYIKRLIKEEQTFNESSFRIQIVDKLTSFSTSLQSPNVSISLGYDTTWHDKLSLVLNETQHKTGMGSKNESVSSMSLIAVRLCACKIMKNIIKLQDFSSMNESQYENIESFTRNLLSIIESAINHSKSGDVSATTRFICLRDPQTLHYLLGHCFSLLSTHGSSSFACIRQICQICTSLCRNLCEYWRNLESDIRDGIARSGSRRKYSYLVLNMSPVVFALTAMSLSNIITHIYLSQREGDRKGNDSSTLNHDLKKNLNMLITFSPCVPSSANSDTEEWVSTHSEWCSCGRYTSFRCDDIIQSKGDSFAIQDLKDGSVRNDETFSTDREAKIFLKSSNSEAKKGFDKCLQLLLSSLRSKTFMS